jgi:hypothetical protein
MLGMAVAVSSLAVAAPANATVLPYTSATSAFAPPNRDEGTTSAYASGSVFVNDPSNTMQSTASGNVYGAGPLVGSKGYVSATATQSRSDKAEFGTLGANGTADLTFDAGVVPTANPPGFVNQFLQDLDPLFVSGVVTVNNSLQGSNASGGGTAEFFLVDKLTGNATFVASVGRVISPGDPEVQTYPYSLNFIPLTDEIQVKLDAYAEADTASTFGHLNASALVTVDPTFEFDQAAFDAEAAQFGFQTFPLDQYFSFEFSPGLDQLGVPEPPSLVLMGFATAATAVLIRRRRIA